MFWHIIGKLIYLTNTHFDIMYGFSVMSRYMNSPQKVHLETIRHILSYLKGTQDMGIFYQ